MTKANSKPVCFGFLDLEAKSLSSDFINLRLHECKLIALSRSSFDAIVIDYFDIRMLVRLRKFVVHLLKVAILDETVYT